MPKRANNEGSIYKRNDGRWCASVSEKGKRKYLYGKTRSQVVKKLKDYQASYKPIEEITAKEYFNKWLEQIRPNIIDSTYIKRKQIIRDYISPAIGHIKLTELKPNDIAEMQMNALKTGAPTAVTAITITRQCLKNAVRHDLIQRNVAEVIDIVKTDKSPGRSLSSEEVTAFLAAVRTHWHYPLFYTALSCGLRRGELIALQWKDLKNGYIDVNKSITRSLSDGWVLGETKTLASVRHAPASKSLMSCLEEHKQKQIMVFNSYSDERFMFCDTKGNMQDPNNLNKSLKTILKKNGLPKFRMHDLRHTFASMHIRLGKDPKTVSGLMGHTNASFTLDRYSHIFKSVNQAEAQSVEDILSMIDDG